MLALLLSVAMAAPPVTETATYDRLFAETEEVAAAVTEPQDPGPALPGWLVPVLLIGGCAGWLGWQWRKKGQKSVASPALRVVQRVSLGDRNAVVLIEVVEPTGETRRLLVGSGSASPVLLADLGLAAMMEPVAEQPANRPDFVEPRATIPQTPAKPKIEVTPSRRIFEEEEEVLPPRRNPRNIADEILAERSPDRNQAPNRDFSRILARIGDE